jgi:hypothetical protein
MNQQRVNWFRAAGLTTWMAATAFVPSVLCAPAASTAQGNAETASAMAGEPDSGAAEPAAARGAKELPADRVETSATVPPSTIEVITLDGKSNPVGGVNIELLRDRQSVAEGNTSTQWRATTDAAGRATFNQVPQGSNSQYRVVAVDADKRYGTRSFAVETAAGTKVTLHVYPLVRDPKQALIAGRGFLFVEPRDEVLVFEYLQHFHNLGQTVFVADNLELGLPKGWKAFTTNPTDADLAVTKTEQGVRLSGVIAPGQHSIVFSFQIPSANSERLGLDLNLWPNTAESQVATVSRSGLELFVEGFPNATVMRDDGRPPFLVTRRSFTRDNGPPSALHVEVAGLPVVGLGRWVAAIAGALFALGALLMAFGRKKAPRADGSQAAAQTRIVEELVALEQAHRQGGLGDSTYADTREVLLSAFVRIERESVSNRI